MTSPDRPGLGPRARWLTLAIVLAVAVIVAVWPRGGGAPSAAATPTISVPTPNLAAARAQAALRPCPTTPAAALTALTRATVTCAASGATVDLGSVLDPAAPTLVNVWAFWCEACQTELPVLESYAATQGAVRVVTLLVQSPAANGLQTLADLHVHLPTVVDASGAVSKALKLPIGLPASYLVRPDGTATLIDSLRTFSTVDQVRAAVSQTEGGQ
ncbi:MAG TPA: TlpA disulfide reductase family protein [Pseudonocardiaceae bacterium]|jgi:thiol-disulfide isomerase/thioredoxin|nr:TlpA disulfide reductase family protein [Pseudonocardiaceae bacterium]